jgi:hypothetical protein
MPLPALAQVLPIAWMVSGQARYVTGAALPADARFTAK